MAVRFLFSLSVILSLSVVSSLPVDSGEQGIKTGLRWEVLESDGRLVRSLSDGQQIITLEYNLKGDLIQCWQTKQGKSSDAIALLFYAAMSDKLASKDAVMINIESTMIACQAYMKKVYQTDRQKPALSNKELQTQIEMVDTLREGFDGSKWCGLMPRKSKAKALKKEDRCCKKWHQCETNIAGYSYDYMMYNYHPYQLMGCNCTVELEKCLRNQTTSVLAEEIVETMMDQSDLRCLLVERREESCVEWDKFFNSCQKKNWASYAKIVTLSQYKKLPLEKKSAQNENTSETQHKTRTTSVKDDVEKKPNEEPADKLEEEIKIRNSHIDVEPVRHEL